jgi:microcystin-dependent protein
MGTSAKRLIRYPELNEVADVPADLTEMAADLDDAAYIFLGTLANLGAASAAAGHVKGSPLTFYYATDSKQLFLSVSAAWVEINMGPQVPIGGSIEYAGAADPADTRWLLEDGRVLVRATYPDLFDVIGTTFNVGGEAATDFRIPDARGRVTVGADNMGTAQGAAGRLPNSNRVRGQSGGEEYHLLSAAESGLPAHGHAHTIAISNAGSHSHGGATASADPVHNHGTANAPNSGFEWNELTTNVGSGGTVVNLPYTLGFGDIWTRFTTEAASIAHAHGISADGVHNHGVTGGVTNAAAAAAANAHNNMQPYQVKNRLIRVK